MGCCETKDSSKPEEFGEKIKSCIQSGNWASLKQNYELRKRVDKNFDINSVRLKVDEELTVDPLGLSVLLDKYQIFSLILEQLGGDFVSMEKNFESSGTTGLSIICLNNYTGTLALYLPHFLSYKKNDLNPIILTKTLTLDQEKSFQTTFPSPATPIQLACESGHISILNYFLHHNKSLTLIPPEIDLHYIEPTTGNNCALISCKTNNFNMIKFLHSQCQADFFAVNHFNENALNILAIGTNENRIETLRCAKYLVEKVGVDPCFNYQETLFMMEDEKTVEYLERVLSEKGVQTCRAEVMSEGNLKFAKRTMCHKYDTGNRFTFTRLFPELTKSVLSSSSLAAPAPN